MTQRAGTAETAPLGRAVLAIQFLAIPGHAGLRPRATLVGKGEEA